jgi:uncharacterized membrane protein
MKSFAVIFAALVLPNALAFTTPSLRAARAIGPASTSPLFMVATNGEGMTDAVLKEFEKKQAQLTKKKEEAMARLNQAESSLVALESKKREYLNGLQLAKSPPGGNFSETTVRSAVKAFAWRIIAGSVTFVTSLQFSGSVKTALSIVGSDFFSKAFTMFIGERIMNKSQAGRKTGSDDVGRSLAKALIWRLFAICNTLTMAVFFAKDISIASKIAGSDAIFKTALMFAYERVWARIQWGKEYLIEFAI